MRTREELMEKFREYAGQSGERAIRNAMDVMMETILDLRDLLTQKKP